MRLLITGSRQIAENDVHFARLQKEITRRYLVLGTGCSEEQAPITMILHGGARGADQLADRFGREYGLEVKVIRPDYKRYPEKLAPLMRNTELVAQADAVIAFYGPRGKAGGTWDTVKKALANNLPITELFADGTVKYTPPQRTLFL
ncbi:MAG: DUF2493 domain-containing protein [Saprospiraceae bacterium]